MTSVLLTGAGTPLGRQVAALLTARGDDVRELDGGTGPLPAADVLVHLAAGDHDALVADDRDLADATPSLLARLTAAGIDHVVLLSSAMVYGAWPNNPVPLTEDAPLRPDASFAFARRLAHVEQLVDEWRLARPERHVAVLRPVLSLAAGATGSTVRALAAGMGQRFGEDDAPAQFLHLDDLASAVTLAVGAPLDGVFNVAPDGWVPGDRVRALSGDGPRLKLPDRVAEMIGRWQWRFQRGPIPPGLRPYTRHPWLVANDRLKAAGWRPTVTNEQAYVEGTEAKWWTMLTPKRKQELALGGMIAASVALVLVLVSLVRRVRKGGRRA